MAGHKILVINDSKVIRRRVRGMLPQGNFDVMEAKDGKEGLELIVQECPNLIMLDFLLPKVTGWEVFQEIQAQPQLKKIPLIITSGRKEQVTEKIPEPFDKYYFAFLETPFEQKAFMGAIKSAFDLAKKRPAEDTIDNQVEAGNSSSKNEALEARIEKIEDRVDKIENNIEQIINLIKQKLK